MESRKLTVGLIVAILCLWGIINTPTLSASDNSNGILKYSKKYFSMSEKVGSEDYMAKTVVLKIKEEFRPYCSRDQVSIAELQAVLDDVGATGIEQRFPFAARPERERNKYGLKLADLSLIYEFKYTGDFKVEDVINAVYELGLVQYAEPHYIYQLLYTPNDPDISTAWQVNKVRAYLAWDLDKGDTNIVIGIIDTGIDIDHPDLIGQIKYNYADPVDGNDNDGDNYVDNFLGWDFLDNDNNPQVGNSDHGASVSGCASAGTDNGVGIGGIGFGCKLLAVRVGDGNIPYGYDGITYAADHGASIINCSWGGPGGGQLGQDVIDYATINKDALVVAAAGNDNSEDLFFPANYNYVLNVASTTSSDTKAGSSNYGYVIDVCAPGEFIYTTNNNGYTYTSGTSFASPVAAGCAALLRSYNPGLDALQTGEQLKVTCDNIYPNNSPTYANKLGSGRVNVYKALSDGIISPSIVMTERSITDGNDEGYVAGDTLQIRGTFINFLAPTSGSVTGTLTASSPDVSIVDGSITLGAFGPFGDSKNNNSDPLLVRILSGSTFNQKVTFELALTDGTYSTNIYFEIIVNVDYINITINDVATSITSKSLVGFNDYITQNEGLGFVYPYSPLGTAITILYDGGLMVGVPNNVSDNMRDPANGVNSDFVSVNNVQRLPVPFFSEFDVEGDFDDSNSPSPMNIEVKHKAFAWSEIGHRKYVIVEYTIKNNSGDTLNSLYAGMYADWDIDPYGTNIAATDQTRYLGYIYDPNVAGYYAGIQVLTPGGFIHYAMFNNQADDPGGSTVYPNNNYSTTEKYTTLSTSVYSAGGTGGKDVSNVVSTGPFDIADGDSVLVAFAILAGDDLADLQESADSAYIKYNGVTIGLDEQDRFLGLFSVYPNPTEKKTSIRFYLPSEERVVLKIYNLLGMAVINIEDAELSAGDHRYDVNVSNLQSGMYLIKLQVGESSQTQRLVISE